MDVTQVLRMNGGTGETSYAKNSFIPRDSIYLSKPVNEAAITALYTSRSLLGKPTPLTIVDFGCSSGPNTFLAVTELIKVVEKLCKKMEQNPPEYQVFLNDLPQNDFNTVFRSLPSNLQGGIRSTGTCYFAGVAGSFYGRLFPCNSIHFAHSSYSLMWLSQVPKGIEGNEKNIYMASTSPRSVLDSFYEQFVSDFSMFLKCRAEELVPGGRMVLTILGRRSENRASSECCIQWELLARALNEMVTEGLIEEEKMDSFTIPHYTPSPLEVKAEVLKEGSFSIDHLETLEVSWSGNNIGDHDENGGGSEEMHNQMGSCMRSVGEPLLLDHFGEDIIEDVFHRYNLLIEQHMSEENAKFTNVVVSLVRSSEKLGMEVV